MVMPPAPLIVPLPAMTAGELKVNAPAPVSKRGAGFHGHIVRKRGERAERHVGAAGIAIRHFQADRDASNPLAAGGEVPDDSRGGRREIAAAAGEGREAGRGEKIRELQIITERIGRAGSADEERGGRGLDRATARDDFQAAEAGAAVDDEVCAGGARIIERDAVGDGEPLYPWWWLPRGADQRWNHC